MLLVLDFGNSKVDERWYVGGSMIDKVRTSCNSALFGRVSPNALARTEPLSVSMSRKLCIMGTLSSPSLLPSLRRRCTPRDRLASYPAMITISGTGIEGTLPRASAMDSTTAGAKRLSSAYVWG